MKKSEILNVVPAISAFILGSVVYLTLQNDISLFILFSSASWIGFLFLLFFFKNGNLGLLAASCISLTYHFGAALTYFFNDYDKILFQTVGRNYHVSSDYIIPALIYSYLFVLFLGLISVIFKNKMSIDISSFPFFKRKESYIWAVVFFLQFYLIATGQFGYMGYDSGAAGNALVLIVDFFSLPLLTVLLVFFIRPRNLCEKFSIVLISGLLINLCWNFMYGRRFLIFSVICALFIVISLKLLTRKKLISVAIISLIIFVLGNVGFVYFRSMVDSDANTIGKIGSVGISELFNSFSLIDTTRVFDSIRVNLSYRLYAFGYFSEVVKAFEPGIFMQNTMSSLATFIPGLTEYANLTVSEELVSHAVGWRFYDEAWSILLGSYVDFNIFGFIFGPVIIAIYIVSLLTLSTLLRNRFSKLFVICGLMITLLAVETDFTRYVIFFRTCLVLLFIQIIIQKSREFLFPKPVEIKCDD